MIEPNGHGNNTKKNKCVFVDHQMLLTCNKEKVSCWNFCKPCTGLILMYSQKDHTKPVYGTITIIFIIFLKCILCSSFMKINLKLYLKTLNEWLTVLHYILKCTPFFLTLKFCDMEYMYWYSNWSSLIRNAYYWNAYSRQTTREISDLCSLFNISS